MSLAPEVVDALIAAGATAEQLGAAVKAACANDDRKMAERRRKDAERKRLKRESEKRASEMSSGQTRTDADIDGQTRTAPDIADTTVAHLFVSNLPPSPPKGGSVPPNSRASKTSIGSRLPDDFELPDDWRQFAEHAGLDPPTVRLEADKFRDYWRGKPGKDGRKSDWPGTWRNWIRRKLENSANARQPPNRPAPRTQADDRAAIVAALAPELDTGQHAAERPDAA